MAVTTKEDLMSRINAMIPEGAEDLTILEDVADTFAYYENTAQTDYQTKYNELAKKYRDRFTDGSYAMEDREPKETGDEPESEQFEKKMTFDSLFERRD